ncbi:hypothetical protein ACFRCG_39940 [Embleya sp. NPDC056575]|uniref:hypothetical protein n=1 Tax=unclassified Embleya TaxID=2699296 RepID=UPI0036C7C6D6
MAAKDAPRKVTSLDALAKQRRDAMPEPSDFELSGVQFTLPPMKLLPIEMQERVGNMQDGYAVLKDVLGAEKIKEMFKAGYTFDDLELIHEEWQARSGLEPGESQASPTS